ncbi:hypothetical protein [Mesorhizobium captivum]|uniref:hypothetical protein n=1 Tax=Mesorhizobium captivum TaxID=3072319 RepID=UPI002A24A3CC|nr:hypothetical protein [Mesorhizobium sp. VK23E]MDX8515558.1 hypothetical protein [Mesorhizobium sp. VK23E]
MKKLPLLAATAIGLFGILATGQSFAGSDHGGQVTAALPDDNDDQGAAAGDDGDRDVAENDETGHKGQGVGSGSYQDDQGDDEDGEGGDHDHDGGDSAGHDGGDSGSHDGGDGGSHDGGDGGDGGSHDGGDD